MQPSWRGVIVDRLNDCLLRSLIALLRAWFAVEERWSAEPRRRQLREVRERLRTLQSRPNLRSGLEVLTEVYDIVGTPEDRDRMIGHQRRAPLLEERERLEEIRRETAEDPAAAAAQLQGFLQLQPDNFLAYSYLATALEEAGDLTGAVEARRQSVRLAGKVTGDSSEVAILAQIQLGRILVARGDWSEAVEELRQVIDTCRSSAGSAASLAMAHLYLGQALHAQGDHPGACEAWKQAIKWDKNSASAEEARELLRRLAPAGTRSA